MPRACALRCAAVKGASCAVVAGEWGGGRRGRGGVASEVFGAAAAVWGEGEVWNGEGGIFFVGALFCGSGVCKGESLLGRLGALG